eukprot:m.231340 g.231340  ORF g.231340 m.231340 type:complete len:618 (-) comp12199_c0_seq1:161-2014(-)
MVDSAELKSVLEAIGARFSDADFAVVVQELGNMDAARRDQTVNELCNGHVTVDAVAGNFRKRKNSSYSPTSPAPRAKRVEDLKAFVHIFGESHSLGEIETAYDRTPDDLLSVARALASPDSPVHTIDVDASPIPSAHSSPVRVVTRSLPQPPQSGSARSTPSLRSTPSQPSPTHQPPPSLARTGSRPAAAAWGPSAAAAPEPTKPDDIIAELMRRFPGRFSAEALGRFVRGSGATLSGAVELLGSMPAGQDRDFFANFASVPAPPVLLTCNICLDEKEVDAMCFLPCDHRFCFECLRHEVESKVDENMIPSCPEPACRVQLPQRDAELVFIDSPSSPYVPRIAQLYLNTILASSGAIPCPRPGCKNAFFPSAPGEKEKCVCGVCGMIFCSLCRNDYHHDLSCEETRAIAARWDQWIQSGREKYMRQRALQDGDWRRKLAEYETRKDKHSKEVQDAMQRRSEQGRDEQWKAQNCRHCPRCNRVIERMSGCDSMVCGQDAHGGNQQNGCGTSFSWPSARPYVAVAEGGPAVAEFAEAAPDRGIEDIMLTSDTALPCDVCHGHVADMGFRCINCPGAFTVCAGCEATVTAPGGHNGAHVFRQVRKSTPYDDVVVVDMETV